MKKVLLTCLLIGSLFIANAQTYLTEDFEGGALPTGWTQSTLASDGGWLFGTAAAMSSNYFTVATHTKIACTNDDACTCNKSNDLIKSPVIDLSSSIAAALKFDCFFYKGTDQGITESAKIVSSVDGGTTWTDIKTLSGVAGWTTLIIPLASLAGQSNVMIGFKYNDGGGWLYGWAIDNVSVYELATNDAELVSLTPVAGSSVSYDLVNVSKTLAGKIFNNGAATITGFTIKYSDGTNVYSDVKTGLSIASLQSYSFTHSTPFVISSLGAHNLKVWVEMAGDPNRDNDSLFTTITGVPFLPVHKVVFEEATGTWCQWCVRGIVFMDSIASVHPDDAILIAVHNNDPMVVTPYDNGMKLLISGYPTVLVDRGTSIDPSEIFTSYDNRKSNFGFAEVSPLCTHSSVTDSATITVSTHFATDLSGDYRIAVVFTEDDCHGTGASWDQENAYAGGGNGPMGGFENLPATIPAAQMYYDHVAKVILGGFNGQAASLPSTLVAGTTYTHIIKYKIPSTSVVSKMHCYALLIDVANNQILNANSAPIVSGIDEVSSGVSGLTLYPNPSSDFINLDLTLNKSQNVVITITDVLGKVTSKLTPGHLMDGSHSFRFDINALSTGVYNLNIMTDSGMVSRKFVK